MATQSDLQNCGACSHACASGEVCLAGTCAASTAVWLAAGLTSPWKITVDAQNVYWTDLGDNAVRSVPRIGGSPRVLARAQAKPYGIAVDDAYVYWSNNVGGTVLRAPKDGSGAPSLVATATSPMDVAVHANVVYWLQPSAFLKAPAVGGPSVTLGTETGGATFNMMTFDGGCSA